MYKLIFQRDDGKIEIGKVKTEKQAKDKLADMFFHFCRDVSKLPLKRVCNDTGFTWTFKGTNYSLYFEEEKDG